MKIIWRFLKRLFNDNPYVDYEFVTRDKLHHYKENGWEVLDRVVDDNVVTKKIVTPRGEQLDKEYILRLNYFMVGKRENDYIRELHERINVGSENFEEYDRMRQRVAEVENEIKRIEKDHQPLKEELQDYTKKLAYMKTVLGNTTFDNYMNNYESIQRQRAAHSAQAHTSGIV